MVALLIALAFAVAPPPPGTFIDAAGDSGTAPDITRVVAGANASGQMTFTVSFATPYGASSSLFVYLNTDKSQSTGDPSGADYRLGPAGLEIWDGAAQDWEPSGGAATFSVAPGGRALAATVAEADVGSPASANFVVQSIDGAGGAGHMDTAIGIWSKSAGSGLKVVTSNTTTPKAGATWAVTLTASGGDASATAADAAVACKSGTAKLVAVRHVVLAVRNGTLTGLCLFRVPKTLKGKKLHATITVSLAGLSASKALAATSK
ncbi:MAG: hypothetical protein ACJ768_03795 [Gaiellaceae bacterium]